MKSAFFYINCFSFSVFLAFAYFFMPIVTVAQETNDVPPTTASTPRPKITTNFTITLGRGGYHLRAFFGENAEPKQDSKFNEGNTFSSNLVHLFHEPLMYVLADDHGSLYNNIDENGKLTLYVSWDPNPGANGGCYSALS